MCILAEWAHKKTRKQTLNIEYCNFACGSLHVDNLRCDVIQPMYLEYRTSVSFAEKVGDAQPATNITKKSTNYKIGTHVTIHGGLHQRTEEHLEAPYGY